MMDQSESPLEMRITVNHARLMVFAGAVIVFGAGLLSLIVFEPDMALLPKIPVAGLVVYLAWVGGSYITGARKWRKRPMVVLTEETIEFHEDWSEGEIRYDEIVRCDVNTRRNVEIITVYAKARPGEKPLIGDKEGWQIPSTLEHYDEAKKLIFSRMPSEE